RRRRSAARGILTQANRPAAVRSRPPGSVQHAHDRQPRVSVGFRRTPGSDALDEPSALRREREHVRQGADLRLAGLVDEIPDGGIARAYARVDATIDQDELV